MSHRNDASVAPASRLAGWSETAQASSTQPTLAFPGLTEIIRLVEEALGQRRTDSITAHLRAHLPAILQRHADRLPGSLLQADPQRYRRIELHHCPIAGYQILAMVWGPGQGTGIHDHNDLWGIEAVIHGELQVARFEPVEVAGQALRLKPREVVELRAGDIEALDAEHGLHLCRNPSPRSVAVSLHVYQHPIDSFGVYEPEGDGWYLRREHLTSVETLTR